MPILQRFGKALTGLTGLTFLLLSFFLCFFPRDVLYAQAYLLSSNNEIKQNNSPGGNEGQRLGDKGQIQKASDEKDPSGFLKEFPIEGYFKIKYRLRWTQADGFFHSAKRDQDLYEYLYLNIGDEQKNKITASLYARSTQDLDYFKNTKGFYVFDSITDTYRSRWNAQIYHLYVDIHQVSVFDKIRVGRQYLYDTPETLYFDGVSAETTPFARLNDLTLGVYGGLPTHLFESSPSGKGLGGMYLTFKPFYSNRVRLDWIHVEDNNTLGNHVNNLYAASFYQNFSEYLQFYTRATALKNNLRDLTLRGTYFNPEKDLTLSAYFKTLLKVQRSLSLEFDPYYSILQDYYPYKEYQFDVSKGLGEHFSLAGGLSLRRLDHSVYESRFNHGFNRFYLSPTLLDFPWKKTAMTLTTDWWNGFQGDHVQTYGFDITHSCTSKLKTSIGTYYSLYKYDYYVDKELNRVRTYYLKGKYQWKKRVAIEGRYEFEKDGFNNYDLLEVGVRFDF